MRAVPSLSDDEIGAMYALFDAYYDGAEPQRFRNDLAAKQHCIVLAERDTGVVKGFSTLRVLEPEELERRCRVIYSGDTAVDRDYWGSKAIQAGFTKFMLTLRYRKPLEPLYWMLTTKGYKTYLLMTNYFPRSYPRFDRAMPGDVAELRDHLGASRYGDRYDPDHGVIRFAGELDRLRAGVADITDAELADPHIRYFAQRNPGYIDGDELLCLARIQKRDSMRILARVLYRRWRG